MKTFSLLFLFPGAVLLSGCVSIPIIPTSTPSPRLFAEFPVSSQSEPAFEGDHPVVVRATNVLVPALEKLGFEVGKPARGVFGKHFLQEFHHPKLDYNVSLFAAYNKRPRPTNRVLFLNVSFYGWHMSKIKADHEAIAREVENLLHGEFPEVKFTRFKLQ